MLFELILVSYVGNIPLVYFNLVTAISIFSGMTSMKFSKHVCHN